MTEEIDDLIERLATIRTKQELDALRPAVGAAITSDGEASFKRLQGAFIKAKNRIRYGRSKP